MPRLSTTPQRSYNMSRIRSRDTKPELMLRKALWNKGVRYRTHARDLPGRPDIVIRKYRLAIFVDGEFWHGKGWNRTQHHIHNNKDFWIAKIERNMERDQENNELLREMGYTVMRFWATEVMENLSGCVNQIRLYIESARDGRIPREYDGC